MPTSPAVLSTSPTFLATGANLASVAMQSVNATVVLWSELLRNQTTFSIRVLEVMTKQPQSGGSRTLESIGATRVDPQVEPAEEVSPVLAAPQKKSTARASSNDLAAADLPIKRYDALTVQAIVAKLDRLRDPVQVRAVIAYEGANKARKGVLAAGESRIRRLRDQ